MKTEDKKQPDPIAPLAENEPQQSVSNNEQTPTTQEPETPATDEGFVVVGSGLGIDE